MICDVKRLLFSEIILEGNQKEIEWAWNYSEMKHLTHTFVFICITNTMILCHLEDYLDSIFERNWTEKKEKHSSNERTERKKKINNKEQVRSESENKQHASHKKTFIFNLKITNRILFYCSIFKCPQYERAICSCRLLMNEIIYDSSCDCMTAITVNWLMWHSKFLCNIRRHRRRRGQSNAYIFIIFLYWFEAKRNETKIYIALGNTTKTLVEIINVKHHPLDRGI